MNCCNIRKIKIGIALVYALAFFCVFLYDQPQKPEATKLINSIPKKMDTANNLYCAMLGFNCPTDTGIHSYGVKKIDRLRAHKDSGQKGDPPAEENVKKNELKGKMPSFYDKKGAGLRQFIAKEPQKVEALLNDNREMVQRYLSLRRYTNYDEPLFFGFSMPIPGYSQISDAQRLEQLRLMRSGNTAEVLKFVRDDLAFWRSFANSTKILIGKLIATRAIQRNYYFLSEFTAGTPLDETSWKVVTTELLQPIPYSELSLSQAFPTEFYCMQDILSHGFNPSGDRLTLFLEPLFGKRQMTINALYDAFVPYLQQAEQSAQEFAQPYKKIQESLQSDKKYGDPLINWLTNPAGEILVRVSAPKFLSYAERSYRVEAVRRLALLKLQIIRQELSDKDIPVFLARAGKELSDPFTGNPMSWDSKSRKIYIKRIEDATALVDMYLE